MSNMLIRDDRFGNRDPINLSVGRYENGNTALEGAVLGDFPEPWCKYTVNMGVQLPYDQVAIKNWSENANVEDVLIANDVIEPGILKWLDNGHIQAPVYKLTAEAMRKLGILP